MTTESEKGERISREIGAGDEAKASLKVLDFHFTAFRAHIFQDISESTYKETDKREELYRQLKSIEYVESRLKKSIQTGKLAEKELSMWQTAKNKLKQVI